ncbi:hypothetical protein ANO11243_092530 [Dothideomycetidae sp. 11243]|nr:hypothetical protein ANO11243_092530 [fungal sp. No.11243]
MSVANRRRPAGSGRRTITTVPQRRSFANTGRPRPCGASPVAKISKATDAEIVNEVQVPPNGAGRDDRSRDA